MEAIVAHAMWAKDYYYPTTMLFGIYLIEIGLLIISYQMFWKCLDYFKGVPKAGVPLTWDYWLAVNWITIGFVFSYILLNTYTWLHITIMCTWTIGLLLPSMVSHNQRFGKGGFVIALFEDIATIAAILYFQNTYFSMIIGNLGKLWTLLAGHRVVANVLFDWKKFVRIPLFNFANRILINVGYLIAYMGGAHKNLFFLCIIEFVNIFFLIYFHIYDYLEKNGFLKKKKE